MPDSRANASATWRPRKRHRPSARHRVRRDGRALTRRPPSTTSRAATAIASVGSGSNVQPSRSVGGRRRLRRDRAVGRGRARRGQPGAPADQGDGTDEPDRSASRASSHEPARADIAPRTGPRSARRGNAPGIMAAARPAGCPVRHSLGAAPRPGARRPREDAGCRAPQDARRSPRARSSDSLSLVGAHRRRVRRSSAGQRCRRPGRRRASIRRWRSTEQGAEIRDLYDIVFLIAVAIFFLVEGLIVWTVLRYRRRPGTSTLPPQTHGNTIAEIVWTIVPTIIVAFLFVISWQTLNEVDAPVAASPDIKIRRSPGSSSGSSTTCPATAKTVAGDASSSRRAGEGGGLTVPTGRTVQLYLDQPGRHPRVLRAAVPVQARRRAGPGQQVRLQGR